jgi:hypothetical protein
MTSRSVPRRRRVAAWSGDERGLMKKLLGTMIVAVAALALAPAALADGWSLVSVQTESN